MLPAYAPFFALRLFVDAARRVAALMLMRAAADTPLFDDAAYYFLFAALSLSFSLFCFHFATRFMLMPTRQRQTCFHSLLHTAYASFLTNAYCQHSAAMF